MCLLWCWIQPGRTFSHIVLLFWEAGHVDQLCVECTSELQGWQVHSQGLCLVRKPEVREISCLLIQSLGNRKTDLNQAPLLSYYCLQFLCFYFYDLKLFNKQKTLRLPWMQEYFSFQSWGHLSHGLNSKGRRNRTEKVQTWERPGEREREGGRREGRKQLCSTELPSSLSLPHVLYCTFSLLRYLSFKVNSSVVFLSLFIGLCATIKQSNLEHF